jgi:Arc/MetJ family transcription regulator
MRKRATFTVDEELLQRIEHSRGERSASERVNELLRRGLERELEEELGRQAQQFFAKPDADERAEREGFLKLTKKSWARDHA